MFVICDGMQRSGSTWSVNIVKGLLKDIFPQESIYSGYEENIAEFVASVPSSAKHIVLKSHLLDHVGKALIRGGRARAIYTFRPLPDVTASFMKIFNCSFDEAFLSITASLVIYRYHVRERNALLLAYEDIIDRPQATIQVVADYLELQVEPAIVERLAHEQSLSAIIGRGHGSNFEPDTLLLPNHIQNGGHGYGQSILSSEQLEKLSALGNEYGFFPKRD